MTTTRKPIVVGVDESEASRAAVQWAAREAVRRESPLTLMHCYTTPTYAVPMVGVLPTSPYANAREDAERALEGAKATAAEVMGRRQVDTLMINGSAAAGLADEAPNAEMIVIGTSGRHQISGVTLGSVASRLAGNLPCPLIVIRAARSDAEWDQHPIVVGVDGSHASDSALEFAFDEASRRGVPLIAVRVWDDTVFNGYMRVYALPVDRHAVDLDENESLSQSLSPWRDKYPDVKTAQLVLRGHPVGAILEHLESTGTELPQPGMIVVGSRGRGGFRGLVLGSTGHGLLAHATCPVAIVRPTTHAKHAPVS